MKEKALLFMFILYNILKITFQQQLMFPIDIEQLIEDENDEDEKNIKLEDGEKPIVETTEYKGEDGSNIRITRIHYNRTKNLKEDSEAITPFQMMRIFDERINSIFENMIRESMGINMLLNRLSVFDDDENEENEKEEKQEKEEIISKNSTDDDVKSIFEELDFDDEEDDKNKYKVDNNNINNNVSNIGENDEKNEKNEKRILKKENNDGKDEKNIGKLKENMDNVKNKIKNGKKKLNRKQLIFSRICKYIFYSLILFTIYLLVKKLLEFLEIIDPDNVVEVNIENDESAKLKKITQNKQC